MVLLQFRAWTALDFCSMSVTEGLLSALFPEQQAWTWVPIQGFMPHSNHNYTLAILFPPPHSEFMKLKSIFFSSGDSRVH